MIGAAEVSQKLEDIRLEAVRLDMAITHFLSYPQLADKAHGPIWKANILKTMWTLKEAFEKVEKLEQIASN